MNRLFVCTFLMVFFAVGGCATKPHQAEMAAAKNDRFIPLVAVSEYADGAMHEVEAAHEQPAVRFRLGAGDGLGHSMFVNYVAYVQANRIDGAHYATGAVKE